MTSNKTEAIEPLKPEDITLDGEKGIIWRLCLRNGWKLMPDMTGGEPFVAVECVAYMLGVSKKTLQNDYLNGVPRYYGGLVRMSEVKQRRGKSEEIE